MNECETWRKTGGGWERKSETVAKKERNMTEKLIAYKLDFLQ